MCKNIFTPSTSGLKKQQAFEAQQAADAKAQEDAAAQQQQQLLLQQEQDRENNVKSGNTAIDNAFSGFNDGYYTNAYDAANTPQLDQQFSRAQDSLKAALAGRGVLGSSVGNQALADLSSQDAAARTTIANNGLDFANQLRSQVASSKNNLYAQSASAADPNAIGSAAVGQSSALAQQGAITPQPGLGDVFASFIAPYTAASTAAQNANLAALKAPVTGLAPTGALSYVVGKAA